MSEITFEKVSAEDAKSVIDAGDVPTPAFYPDQNRQEQRETTGVECEELGPLTFAWLSQLPSGKRPNHLAHQFPRIANQLADLWKYSLRCELYLDTLAVDLRGGRRGFPPEVANEIVVLKNYYTTEVAPVRYDVWGERIGFVAE